MESVVLRVDANTASAMQEVFGGTKASPDAAPSILYDLIRALALGC